MDNISLKREKQDAHLSVSMQGGLKEKLQKFADENGVPMARAARYIIAAFLDRDYGKTENLNGKTKKRTQRKQEVKS